MGRNECHSCRYWKRIDAGDVYPPDESTFLAYSEVGEGEENFCIVGQCRRYPPVIVSEHVRREIAWREEQFKQTFPSDLYMGTSWPITSQWGWCGEFDLDVGSEIREPDD